MDVICKRPLVVFPSLAVWPEFNILNNVQELPGHPVLGVGVELFAMPILNPSVKHDMNAIPWNAIFMYSNTHSTFIHADRMNSGAKLVLSLSDVALFGVRRPLPVDVARPIQGPQEDGYEEREHSRTKKWILGCVKSPPATHLSPALNEHLIFNGFFNAVIILRNVSLMPHLNFLLVGITKTISERLRLGRVVLYNKRHLPVHKKLLFK